MCFFLQGFKGFVARYPGLFKKPRNENTEENTERDKSEYDKHIEHWGWVVTLDIMSGGDRTKWDYFLNMNVKAMLNYIAYLKDKKKWQA